MEQSNYYTLAQVAREVAKNKYKLVECLDQSGAKVIPGHPANIKPEKWILNNLKTWYNRTATKEGVYYVCCYLDSRRKTDPDNYPIFVGTVPKNSPPPAAPVNVKVVMPKNNMSEATYNPLSFENYNLLMQQISDLKTDKVTLTAENKRLKEENDELRSDAKTHLSEKDDKDFFASLMPIADVFLKEREQNRMIGLVMASASNPQLAQMLPYIFAQQQPTLSGNGKAAGGMPPPVTSKDESIAKANKFIKDELTDEEYKKVEAIRNANPTLDAFYTAFMQGEPEIYQRMYNYVNGAA